jgi:hypothetical protein
LVLGPRFRGDDEKEVFNLSASALAPPIAEIRRAYLAAPPLQGEAAG